MAIPCGGGAAADVGGVAEGAIMGAEKATGESSLALVSLGLRVGFFLTTGDVTHLEMEIVSHSAASSRAMSTHSLPFSRHLGQETPGG